MTEKEFKKAFARIITLWGLPRNIRLDTDKLNTHMPTAKDLFNEYFAKLKHIPADAFDEIIDRALDEPYARPFPSIPFLRQMAQAWQQPASEQEQERTFRKQEAEFNARVAKAKAWLKRNPDKEPEIEAKAQALCGNAVDYLWDIPLIRENALRCILVQAYESVKPGSVHSAGGKK